MLVDLHMHSTFSDGRFTPTELVKAAVAKGLGVIAITDHDSWNGIDEALAAAEQVNKAAGKQVIRVITGVELGSQYKSDSVHILGLHVDRSYQPLQEKMDDMRHKREHRLEDMVEKLHNMGYEITVEACDPKNRAVGRPHVAKAMVAKGYVASVQEAFDKFLRRGGPAYVPQPKLSPEEAVQLIHEAGGIAILAHPGELADSSLPEYLVSHVPFDGIEIKHPSAMTTEEQAVWLELAHKYKLMTSGGSDYHGIPDRFPQELGIWQVQYEDAKEVIEYKL